MLVCIVGSNGAGKSTLMRTISGLIKPNKGKILYRDKDISHLSAHEITDMGIVYVPEGKRLFNRMSVIDNLLVGSYCKQTHEHRGKNLAEIFEMFPVLGERKNQAAGTLSGGEQQMLSIARGLMACPKIILLDELSLGIAPVLVDQILKTVSKLKSSGLTILLSEQNVKRSLEIADIGVVLQTGKIVMKDKAKDLLKSDIIKKSYLGM
jgi:branched-chain amino acid transport system ATP-binding protein